MKNSEQSELTQQTKFTNELYQEVTNKIIALLEQGVTPWRRTWSTYGLARNYATGHIYNGINFILMNNTSYSIPYFLTFKQIQEQGGRLRKGAKSEKVIYFSMYYKDANDWTLSKEDAQARSANGEEIQVLKFIKYYNVFNVADVEGIDFVFREIKFRPNEKIKKCESIIKNMYNRPEIMNDGDQAYYSPSLDFVHVPDIKHFETSENYYAVLFHELVHSTGHITRLAREAIINPQEFGSKPYSREELVGEMGASYLCSSVQINYDSITETNAAYLLVWLKVLKEDSKFIFKVAAEAQKAVDYILKPPKQELELEN